MELDSECVEDALRYATTRRAEHSLLALPPRLLPNSIEFVDALSANASSALACHRYMEGVALQVHRYLRRPVLTRARLFR